MNKDLDVGIVFGTSSDHYVLKDGSEFDLDTRWSTTLIKEEGRWQIASLQISSNLFDNPVTSALSKFVMTTGVIAGLVGLVLGYFVAKLLARKRDSASPAAE